MTLSFKEKTPERYKRWARRPSTVKRSATNCESSAFGLHELTVVALGQVAKDRAVQSRMGRLATGLDQ